MINLFSSDYFMNPVPNGKFLRYGVLFDEQTGELSVSEFVRDGLDFSINFFSDEEITNSLKLLPDGWCYKGESLPERLIEYGKANLSRVERVE